MKNRKLDSMKRARKTARNIYNLRNAASNKAKMTAKKIPRNKRIRRNHKSKQERQQERQQKDSKRECKK